MRQSLTFQDDGGVIRVVKTLICLNWPKYTPMSMCTRVSTQKNHVHYIIVHNNICVYFCEYTNVCTWLSTKKNHVYYTSTNKYCLYEENWQFKFVCTSMKYKQIFVCTSCKYKQYLCVLLKAHMCVCVCVCVCTYGSTNNYCVHFM